MQYEVVWELVLPWISNEVKPLTNKDKQALAKALKSIQQKLAHKPMAFGEPHFKYKAAQLIYCVAIHRGLVIEYGVHKTTRTVFCLQAGLAEESLIMVGL